MHTCTEPMSALSMLRAQRDNHLCIALQEKRGCMSAAVLIRQDEAKDLSNNQDSYTLLRLR